MAGSIGVKIGTNRSTKRDVAVAFLAMQIWALSMPRKSSAGLPFLLRRPDSGRYAYWRKIPTQLSVHLRGSVALPWSLDDHDLSGKPNLKIALDTQDDGTARERWALVHAQVQDLLVKATHVARTAKSSQAPTAGAQTRKLTPSEVAAMARQACHDVLADHDASWADPNHFSPLAIGLKRALLAIRSGKLVASQDSEVALTTSNLIEWLNSLPDDMTDDDIRTTVRKLEIEALKANIARGDLGILDQSATIEEYKLRPGGGYHLDKITEEQSELSKRLQENNLQLGDAEVEKRKAGLAIMRARLAALETVEAREAGNPAETPDRPAPISNPKAERKPGLRELHEIWRGEKQRSQKTIDDNLLYVDRFVDLVGDVPVDQIKREHIRKYRDALKQYPRSPPAEYARGRVEDALAWARAHPKERRLTPRTINAKGLRSISTLMDLALLEGHIDANPCLKLRLEDESQGDAVRLPFDYGDLNKLFSSPLFSHEKWLPKTGGYEAAFWMPLIALFAGARLEEIGQLLVSDIKHSGDYHYFSMTTLEDSSAQGSDAPDPRSRLAPRVGQLKSLKTRTSRRRVPVHPVLVELGFLDFVARRTRESGERLFNHVHGYRGRITKNWSRWWGRYQNKHVTDMPEKVFHSFRHNFTDALRAAEVQRQHVKALLGHSGRDTTDEYGLGFPISVLAREIAKIQYAAVDVAALRRVARKAI